MKIINRENEFTSHFQILFQIIVDHKCGQYLLYVAESANRIIITKTFSSTVVYLKTTSTFQPTNCKPSLVRMATRN